MKVEVAVLGSQSLTVLIVFVGVKQYVRRVRRTNFCPAVVRPKPVLACSYRQAERCRKFWLSECRGRSSRAKIGISPSLESLRPLTFQSTATFHYIRPSDQRRGFLIQPSMKIKTSSESCPTRRLGTYHDGRKGATIQSSLTYVSMAGSAFNSSSDPMKYWFQ